MPIEETETIIFKYHIKSDVQGQDLLWFWVQIRHFSFKLFKPGIYDYYRHSVDPWWPERVRIYSKLVACPKKIAFGDGKVFFFLHIFLLVVSYY